MFSPNRFRLRHSMSGGGVREAMGVEVAAPEFAYRLPRIAAAPAPCGSEAWTATSANGAPSARVIH